jgi:hypothetical protein
VIHMVVALGLNSTAGEGFTYYTLLRRGREWAQGSWCVMLQLIQDYAVRGSL